MLNFQQYLEGKKIDREAVMKDVEKAAETIHGKVDKKILKSMIDSAIDEKGAKDTEDIVQIVIDMMRSKS